MRLFIHAWFRKVFHPNLQTFVWNAMLLPRGWCLSEGHQDGRRKVTKRLSFSFAFETKVVTPVTLKELFSQQKLEEQLIFWPTRKPYRAAILMSRNAQTFKRALLLNDKPCRA